MEQRLREREDVSLRLFVRDARKLTGETRQRAEVFEGDAMCLPDLRRALAGVDTAFYLIRAGEDGQDFPHPDRISAENFLQACLDQGVRTSSILAVPPMRTQPRCRPTPTTPPVGSSPAGPTGSAPSGSGLESLSARAVPALK
ncbi:NAD(P)H-binding protein [Desulfobulbus elongatus]|uniref:NAD(P)H-binding protein n=1 Tax=Desulfobulbus elongatus TaxID=53332 RepID=UPI001FE132E8|nr:NAD(P)H-binding protein [Desulfobulbus elongatus]